MIERPYVREVSIISMTFRLPAIPFESLYYTTFDLYYLRASDYTNESEENKQSLQDIKFWSDKRVVFERIAKDIDGVCIATPEHNYYIISTVPSGGVSTFIAKSRSDVPLRSSSPDRRE
ncbi:MAG: hypothetical protein ACYS8Z_04055 [Planctomycetota bacterium]|jgi:hypothetical protein